MHRSAELMPFALVFFFRIVILIIWFIWYLSVVVQESALINRLRMSISNEEFQFYVQNKKKLNDVLSSKSKLLSTVSWSANGICVIPQVSLWRATMHRVMLVF
jgi:hypothetical protein